MKRKLMKNGSENPANIAQKPTEAPLACGASIPNQQQQSIAALLSRRQVAERWRVCPHTVARRKDLRPVRFGPRLLRYRLQDVLAIELAAAV